MTDDRALEVKLIGMRVLANGEVNLPFVVQKDDAWKTQTFIGMIGRPFQMILIPINYEATEDFVPLTSADFTKAALTPGVIGTQDSAADNSGGIPPTERTDTRTAPEAELKQSPGNLSRRAAIWCQKPEVQLFMHKEYCIPRNFESVKGKVKELLDIQSFKEIVQGSPAASDYLALELKFMVWLNDPKYVPTGV